MSCALRARLFECMRRQADTAALQVHLVVGGVFGGGANLLVVLALLLGGWGTAAGDVNADGSTDASDLSMLLGNWGA